MRKYFVNRKDFMQSIIIIECGDDGTMLHLIGMKQQIRC